MATLFDEDDQILYDLWTKQNLIMLELLRMLDEDEEEDRASFNTRNRSRRRNVDQLSQHWEVECQDMPDVEFFQRFRMTRPTFLKLLSLIEDDVKPRFDVGDSIPADKRLAVTLRYLADGGTTKLIGDAFGIAERTVRAIVTQVCIALSNCPTLNGLVAFPETENDYEALSRRFFDRFQFPNCCGAVDDTHIPINKPGKKDDPASYFDYKKDYSIHLQAVCDADTRILFYHIGAPGKNNDGGVMEMSGLKQILNSGSIPDRFHLVGDPAFPLHVNLMTRFPGVNLTPFQSRYNWRQSRCRMIVEQLFGQLKGKWRILLRNIQFRDLSVVNKIVKTCVLLHNFLLDNDVELPGAYHSFEDEEYRRLMRQLDFQRETALTEAAQLKTQRRKRKSTTKEKPLPPNKIKRNCLAASFENDLNENNCCEFLGM